MVQRLARSQAMPLVVARVLVGRGHTDVDATARHLTADLKDLHDPGLLPGMQAATERLERARERGETVLVHGTTTWTA